MENYYSKTEKELIIKTFTERKIFYEKELSVKYNSEECIKNFFSGNFIAGSANDLTLDWKGTPIIEYKFNNVPKKDNTMEEKLNKITEAVLIPQNDSAELSEPVVTTKDGVFSETKYFPSKKFPGQFIGQITFEKEGLKVSSKFRLKEVSDLFAIAKRSLDAFISLIKYNVSFETEDGTTVVNVNDIDEDTISALNPLVEYLPEFEEEEKSFELHLNKPEDIENFVSMLDNKFKTLATIITKRAPFMWVIDDGTKKGIHYISEFEPEVSDKMPFLIFADNITSVDYGIPTSSIKKINRVHITKKDMEEILQVMFQNVPEK